MRVLILSGGSIEDSVALEWIKNNIVDMTIAADSGMNFFYRNNLMPDVIVGDFDSADSKAYSYFSKQEQIKQIRLNPIKDDTDTEYVIRYAIEQGATSIVLLGATGTRLDHVLANIYLLEIGLKENVQMQILDAYNRIRMVEDVLTIEKEEQYGDYVSILPVGGSAKGVTIEGFRYPLKDAQLVIASSLGVSNEIVGEKARIQVQEGRLLVIESKD